MQEQVFPQTLKCTSIFTKPIGQFLSVDQLLNNVIDKLVCVKCATSDSQSDNTKISSRSDKIIEALKLFNQIDKTVNNFYR